MQPSYCTVLQKLGKSDGTNANPKVILVIENNVFKFWLDWHSQRDRSFFKMLSWMKISKEKTLLFWGGKRRKCLQYCTQDESVTSLKLKHTTLSVPSVDTHSAWSRHPWRDFFTEYVVWVSDPERGRVISLRATSSWQWPLNLLPLDLCKLNKSGVWWFITATEIQTNLYSWAAEIDFPFCTG